MPYKQYLGDGVYADFENGRIKLSDEDALEENPNVIYLEKYVFDNFVQYVEWLTKSLKNKRNRNQNVKEEKK